MSPISPGAAAAGPGRLRFAVLLTALFLVLAALGASRHELWRDEMQAWLIARDAPDLPALIEQGHYEGAPPLWPLLLRPLTLATHRPEAMQVLTWALAGATVFLIAARAPWGRVAKALLVGNYYLLFEYGTVCRNYLPGILLLVAAAALFPAAPERPWPFVAALVGAALASVYSLIVAVALAAAHAARCRAEAGPDGVRARGAFPAGPLLAVAAGVGLAVLAVLPRADTLYPQASGWILAWNPDRLAKVAWALVCAHFPVPSPPGFFWIPPWHRPPPAFDHAWAVALAVALVGAAVLLLRRHGPALVCYLVGTAGVAGFLYLKYLGFYRHAGFLFITFLLAMWLKEAGGPAGAGSGGIAGRLDRAGGLLLTLMLAVQAVTGLWALRTDLAEPFSCGRQAARILAERHLDRAFIAAGPDWAGAPLAGYLDRSLYFPAARRTGSFTRWDNRRTDSVDDEEFFRRAAAEAKGADFVVVVDHGWPPDFRRAHGIEDLAELHGSLTPYEDYYLYLAHGRAGGPP